MIMSLFLQAVLLFAALPSAEPSAAYASIRVVREETGAPDKPEIILPTGYRLHTESNYEVASPGEYYVFLEGPPPMARNTRVHWPSSRIKAIIQGKKSLELRPGDDGDVLCDIPVTAASLRAAWNTLEIHSIYNEEALSVRIEHNDPRRRAGYYAGNPWVAGQAKACLHFIFASRQILRDWGIHREIAAARVGRISLMGFETNNPLHGDSPPHWHWIHYWPTEPGSQVPHFYMDAKGRVTSNAIVILGHEERNLTVKARDPMIFSEPSGRVRMAIDIRPDGGVDIGPKPGEWTYSIVSGEGTDDFTGSVRVLRRGQPWIRVAADDDVERGILAVRIEPLDGKGDPVVEKYSYDPLTGTPKK
jgi:hypothetical protein